MEATEEAKKKADKLTTELEHQRQTWAATREAHEELKQKFAETTERCDKIRSDRDAVKLQWIATKDDLKDLQMAHQRITNEASKMEEQLAKQQNAKEQAQQQHDDFVAQFR